MKRIRPCSIPSFLLPNPHRPSKLAELSRTAAFAMALGACALNAGTSTPPPRHLSSLGKAPDWSQLAAFHEALTAEQVARLLRQIYLSADSMNTPYLRVDDRALWIRTQRNSPDFYYRIQLREEPPAAANADLATNNATVAHWRALGWTGTPEQPLAGLRIALDPGHIGGNWAVLEQRHFQPDGEEFFIREGDLNLTVALLVRPRLEAQGAAVFLTRDEPGATMAGHPDDYLPAARLQLEQDGKEPDDATVRALANLLFYRVADIRARAEQVRAWSPHLALAIHFDAMGTDPANANVLLDDPWTGHLLVNGAYLPNEIELDDLRFAMIERIFQGHHEVEIPIAEEFGHLFRTVAGLQPYRYRGSNARAVGESGYTYARNLLANRLFPCPVVYLEPYNMNGDRTFARLKAGDFDGEQAIMGRTEISIFREYALMIEQALINYFAGLLASKEISQ